MSQRILHALEAVQFSADKATVTELSITQHFVCAVQRRGAQVDAKRNTLLLRRQRGRICAGTTQG
jgi:hypothetical protein